MSNDTHEKSTLALELTEMGLSLFVCDGDVPVECVAHVALDDPDFSKKLSGFRGAAEKSVGKGFATQIWLPDEQVMFRSLKLDEEESDDARQAASSALSASTPFHGDTLCFDLGDTNGAGYTPVAAIPKEKMDEAMAFAKKMRMNPRLITTSNVVSGFSARPNFKPFAPEVAKRAAPIRVAALAMMLAAPIFLLSAELDSELNGRPDAGNAFVAAVETVAVETSSPSVVTATAPDLKRIDLPVASTQTDLRRAAPRLASADLPSSPDINAAPAMVATQQSVFTMNGKLVATGAETATVILPASIAAVDVSRAPTGVTAPVLDVTASTVSVQMDVLQPNAPANASAKTSISSDDGFRAISTELPTDMFRPGPDGPPDLEMLVVGYVENVFDGDIEIHDLMAVDEFSATAFTDPVMDPSHVRVANIGEGVLVQRPASRAAPKLVQPAFMPRPEKRPLPLLPEQAFDFNTMVPIDPATTVEDPPPIVSGQIDETPSVGRPQGLLFVSDPATQELIEKAAARSRELAVLEAEANRNGPLANLTLPRARDAVPLAGSNGAIAQFRIAKASVSYGADAAITAPQSASSGPATIPAPAQLVASYVAQPRLPQGLESSVQAVAVVRELVPYQPGASAQEQPQETGIRFIDVASRPTMARPPSRRRAETTAPVTIAVDDAPEPAATEPVETIVVAAPDTEPQRPLDATDTPVTALEPTSPSLQAEIAAAAAPDLILPRPPARPDRTTDVAALIQELEPAPAPSGPISKYAIASLYAPAKRPARLEAEAKKIIEERNSVSHQVAKKQEPVAATPQKKLRIPTGARVGSAATIKDGIALGDISLIGIYGTKKTRRALVRLPQGRYVQISRGDRVSGWTVSAVGEDAVRIQKGSKNKVLRLPN